MPGIWAIGDCNGRGAFTHPSYNDFEIVADNLLNGARRSVKDRLTAYGLFTDPPLGRVGMTDTEIRRSGRTALVGMRPSRGPACRAASNRESTLEADTARLIMRDKTRRPSGVNGEARLAGRRAIANRRLRPTRRVAY